MSHEEYLRRNLMVAKAIGAHAAARKALERLAGLKRRPKWLMEAFESVRVRTVALPPDLARWRDAAPDAPQYVAGKKVEANDNPTEEALAGSLGSAPGG